MGTDSEASENLSLHMAEADLNAINGAVGIPDLNDPETLERLDIAIALIQAGVVAMENGIERQDFAEMEDTKSFIVALEEDVITLQLELDEMRQHGVVPDPTTSKEDISAHRRFNSSYDDLTLEEWLVRLQTVVSSSLRAALLKVELDAIQAEIESDRDDLNDLNKKASRLLAEYRKVLGQFLALKE